MSLLRGMDNEPPTKRIKSRRQRSPEPDMPPILRGGKVRLTSLNKDDLPTIMRWYEDTQFGRLFDGIPATPRSEEALKKWLDGQESDSTAFPFAIRPLDGNGLMGIAEVDGILWNNAAGWVSLAIGDPANRGQGFGSEAMRLLLDFAFLELNLHRVTLSVFAYNAPALRLYERLGFRHEGTFREHIHRQGKRYDMLIFGLLRREWIGEEV